MSYQLKRDNIGNGIFFNSINDSKFKHNRISVNFILPLSEETASQNAIVPFLLRRGHKSCPDFTKLNEKLCDLYGAVLDADVGKYGGYQVLEISIKSIDDRFAIENENLIEESARLLSSVVLEPKITDGVFDEEDIKLEKQNIIDTIESEINDKRTYAISRCISEMCKGEAIAVKKYGSREKAEAITSKTAAEAYGSIIKSSLIEIMFTGSGNAEIAKEIFKKSFAELKRTPVAYAPVELKYSADKINNITDAMEELSQSKLVMGFRTGRTDDAKQLNSIRLMVALFGGTPFSLLFQNVREKLSLCYYCAARFDRFTNIMLVDSGILAENKEKAYSEILNQLDALKKGSFTDDELQAARLAVQNSLKSVSDSLDGIEDWYMTQLLYNTQVSPVDDARMFDDITKQDIINAANAVTLDTVYFLKGEEK